MAARRGTLRLLCNAEPGHAIDERRGRVARAVHDGRESPDLLARHVAAWDDSPRTPRSPIRSTSRMRCSPPGGICRRPVCVSCVWSPNVFPGSGATPRRRVSDCEARAVQGVAAHGVLDVASPVRVHGDAAPARWGRSVVLEASFAGFAAPMPCCSSCPASSRTVRFATS